MADMHILSEFLGTTFGVDRQPGTEPHLVVVYWGWDGPELRATYGLRSRKILSGWLPDLGMEFFEEWIEKHWSELICAWEDSERGVVPTPVEPLE